MSIWAAIAIFAAGIGAGTINVIVGSGTLFTFPVLLAAGLTPVTANVSNTLGLVTGNLSGVIGYRRELRDQRRRIIRFGTVALIGGLTGAVLLTTLPPETFAAVVPVLIGLALVLVVLQPRLARALARRRERTGVAPQADGGVALLLGLLLASVYGGYFGAAQGVMYLSLMGLLLADGMQRINALKNVLAVVVNGVAALFFLFAAHPDWRAVLLIAAGSTLGGQIGAKVARRLPPTAMRAVIVLVGVVAMAELLLR
ncbi:sulfite exporter TauE/SafE family protein [Streptomyces sp. NPDC052396]|uniref:sulfite exporter TauE/SafE family protein n=1 Tax=Streptomyces sp. NPDC052396 TaxID=3365689 RepID=UPI0037D9477A